MRVDDLSIDVPTEQIARVPLADRDRCRLMTYCPQTERTGHGMFSDIVSCLDPGDILVANDSKVIPCRLPGTRVDGRELLVVLVSRRQGSTWCCQVRPARGLSIGDTLHFGDRLTGVLRGTEQIGVMMHWLVEFQPPDELYLELERLGELSLPVFADQKVRERELYDTVYAQAPGSGLPPTAGLHFSGEVITQLITGGIGFHHLTLHIGLGSAPVTVDTVEEHTMHGEEYSIPADTADAVNEARAGGRRVVAIGTTVARALETAADEDGTVREISGVSYLYMHPGYRVRCITGLVTNFHPPRSTGLLVTSALIGVEPMLRCYREARDAGYRFYDFGDALLVR